MSNPAHTREPTVGRLADLAAWWMPPIDTLPPANLTLYERLSLAIPRGYLDIADGLILLRITKLATVRA